MSKPRITMIAAVANNGVIGCNNQLPWSLPLDMAFFKQTTLGKPIVMGRHNYASIGRALPGRRNIVLSRLLDLVIPEVEVMHSPEQVLEVLAESEEIMIIGGADVYEAFLSQADRLLITWVDTTAVGDVFFPEVDFTQWQVKQLHRYPVDDRHAWAMRICEYTRPE